MQALRKIVDVPGASLTLDLPVELQRSRVEVIVLPVSKEESLSATQDSWQDFVRKTMGSIPDFPDRAPQGEYEIRSGFDD